MLPCTILAMVFSIIVMQLYLFTTFIIFVPIYRLSRWITMETLDGLKYLAEYRLL